MAGEGEGLTSQPHGIESEKWFHMGHARPQAKVKTYPCDWERASQNPGSKEAPRLQYHIEGKCSARKAGGMHPSDRMTAASVAHPGLCTFLLTDYKSTGIGAEAQAYERKTRFAAAISFRLASLARCQ